MAPIKKGNTILLLSLRSVDNDGRPTCGKKFFFTLLRIDTKAL